MSRNVARVAASAGATSRRSFHHGRACVPSCSTRSGPSHSRGQGAPASAAKVPPSTQASRHRASQVWAVSTWASVRPYQARSRSRCAGSPSEANQAAITAPSVVSARTTRRRHGTTQCTAPSAVTGPASEAVSAVLIASPTGATVSCPCTPLSAWKKQSWVNACCCGSAT